MGLFVQCLYALSLHLVAVVFVPSLHPCTFLFDLLFNFSHDEMLDELAMYVDYDSNHMADFKYYLCLNHLRI